MTEDERKLLLNTMMEFRYILQSSCSDMVADIIVYQNQEIYYRMMDVMVLISLGMKDEYEIPCMNDYYTEFMTNGDTEEKVGCFHEILIQNELLKLGWKFSIEELYFDFENKVDSEETITFKNWEEVIEDELNYLPEFQSELINSTLRELHEIYREGEEEKTEILDIDNHCAYIMLEGPHIPDLSGEEETKKLNDLIFSLICIHNYACSISWVLDSDKLLVCLIILGESYTETDFFEACSSYYLFPGVLLAVHAIQEFIDSLENKK